jgi:hypothetical protein
MTARRRPPKARGTVEPRNGHHRTAILLEALRGQMQVVVERVLDTPTKREFAELAARMEAVGGRVDLLSDALRATRVEIAARFDGVDKRLDGLDQELRGARQDIARQAHGAELRALEQRMTVVERHLGL